MTYYQRRLPHWHPEDAAMFITWRLHDSAPATHELIGVPSGRRFVAADRVLDRAASGPRWLAEPAIAACVAKALRYGVEDLRLYSLHAWAVMCNHVHILITPQVSLSRLTKAIKNFSASEANRILLRTGSPFWLDESYDHWVRNEKQFAARLRYIEFNPVGAGLVANPEDWPWSSASRAGQEACPTLEFPYER